MNTEEKKASFLLAIAYLIWAIFPIFIFSATNKMPVEEVLCLRGLFSFLLLLFFYIFKSDFLLLLKKVLNYEFIKKVSVTAVIILFNWFFYMFAVKIGQSNQACLGYFITPLLNIFLGVLFFKEDIDIWKKIALFFGILAIIYQTIILGEFPFIAVVVGFSFGFYGFFRKFYKIPALSGMLIETMILSILILPLWIYIAFVSNSHFAYKNNMLEYSLYCILAGLFTLVPFVCYLSAVEKLPLNIIGLSQYISPSLQFLVAIFYLQEDFDVHRFISFILVWIGLGIYTTHLLCKNRGKYGI